jgi:hypothetical protein
VRRYLEAAGGSHAENLSAVDGWAGSCHGFRSGFAGIAGTWMWVRQDLAREHGIVASLRTIERAVAGLRQALRAMCGRPCGSRRRRASSCRSILASRGCRSTARVSRHSATPGAASCGVSARAAIGLVRRDRDGVLLFWRRGARGGAARQYSGVRRFGAKPRKSFVDDQTARPSSWKTPRMARRMA